MHKAPAIALAAAVGFAAIATRVPAAPVIAVPCTGEAPAYASVDAQPEVHVYYGDELGPRWAPPACVGWQPANVAMLMTTAGKFRHRGSTEEIAARFGAITKYHSILYWSHTRQTWRPLMPESYALASPDPLAKRADFAAGELAPGVPLYFWQSASGKFAYRLQVRERSADRIVIEMENVTGFQMLFLPVFRPGDARLLYVIERETGETWRYYMIIGISAPFLPIVRSGEPSYINRAVAIFRYSAGIPTDRDPPLAPG